MQRAIKSTRWTEGEWALVERAAELAGSSVSALIRRATLMEATKIVTRRASAYELARIWVPRLFGAKPR